MILYGLKTSLQSQECLEVEEGGVWRSFVKADTHLVILTNKLLHPTATENRRVNKHMGETFSVSATEKSPCHDWFPTTLDDNDDEFCCPVTEIRRHPVAVSYTGTDTIVIFTAVITVVIY